MGAPKLDYGTGDSKSPVIHVERSMAMIHISVQPRRPSRYLDAFVEILAEPLLYGFLAIILAVIFIGVGVLNPWNWPPFVVMIAGGVISMLVLIGLALHRMGDLGTTFEITPKHLSIRLESSRSRRHRFELHDIRVVDLAPQGIHFRMTHGDEPTELNDELNADLFHLDRTLLSDLIGHLNEAILEQRKLQQE